MYAWIALRRVNGGGIARAAGCWFDSGRRVPGYVAETLAALCEAELVTLADLDGMTMARAALTAAGADRFAQLCQQRHKALQARTTPHPSDSGRPPVQHPPQQIPPPGGRPDTTVAAKPPRLTTDSDQRNVLP